MIPNPIVKVLSTLSCHGVRHLLMGGQACVFYGAAEFSRDCDIVVFADAANFDRLRATLAELRAKCIAVPPFDPQYLERGHAVHFRCEHVEAAGMRLDVMTRMRGVDEFEVLWQRRTTLSDDDGLQFELLGFHDLVKAKKTQRDKDWPMIRRLVEAHYESHRENPTEEQVRFWLLESRTPDLLVRLSTDHKGLAQALIEHRPLLAAACRSDHAAIEAGMDAEERAEKDADRAYWQPLKQELEKLRREARRQ